jgi:hypothetical protein
VLGIAVLADKMEKLAGTEAMTKNYSISINNPTNQFKYHPFMSDEQSGNEQNTMIEVLLKLPTR